MRSENCSYEKNRKYKEGKESEEESEEEKYIIEHNECKKRIIKNLNDMY